MEMNFEDGAAIGVGVSVLCEIQIGQPVVDIVRPEKDDEIQFIEDSVVLV